MLQHHTTTTITTAVQINQLERVIIIVIMWNLSLFNIGNRFSIFFSLHSLHTHTYMLAFYHHHSKSDAPSSSNQHKRKKHNQHYPSCTVRATIHTPYNVYIYSFYRRGSMCTVYTRCAVYEHSSFGLFYWF